MTSPIHIVHVVASFGCGGLERVIANLISHSDPKTHKHSIISLTNDLSFRYALPEGINLISLDKKPGHDWGVHIKLFQQLKKWRADVIHTYNFATLEYHAIAKMAGVKRHVHADHGLGGDHPEGKNKKHNIFRKIMAHLIDDYVVVSNDLKSWVVDCVGVPSKKVNFVFNGVSIPERSILPYKPLGSLNMVIVGRLHPVKNHIRLLNAISTAITSYPDLSLSLTVVGGGSEDKNIQNTIQDLGLQNVVTMVGHQNNVAEYISKADVFVLSSDYEAMPMTVLEAMALCRPVICPNVGGVSDFITPEDVYLTLGKDTNSLACKIIELALTSSDSYIGKVNAAYDKVSREYSIEKMVQRYNAFYNAAI
tara:strand:+ start:1169 stop:2263 length:1095 start_codon:yes stop_codon:yes gene_type:complete